MKRFYIALALVAFGLTMAHADDKTRVAYQEVSVHDPSVVVSGDTYYVFGSHLGAAKSSDLLNWTSFGGGETGSCTLFANTSGVQTGYANA